MSEKADVIMEKVAIISWGGQSLILGTKPAGLEVGYHYGLGVLPLPSLGVRVGTRGEPERNIPAVGVTLGTAGIGVSSGEPKKLAPFVYGMRPAPRSIYKYVKDKVTTAKTAGRK